MSTSELRDALVTVAGVAEAEVTEHPDSAPLIRVWLDGSRDGAEVERDIDGVITELGYHGSYRSAPAKEPAADEANGRRAGLGRGLDTLIPVVNEEAAAPTRLQEVRASTASAVEATEREGRVATIEPSDEVRFTKVSIEEDAKGVWIRVEDSSGRSASAEVGHGEKALDTAVATAVATLRGTEVPRILAVELRTMEGSDIISVLLELRSRRRVAGAAVLEGGQPYTIGKAIWSALASVD